MNLHENGLENMQCDHARIIMVGGCIVCVCVYVYRFISNSKTLPGVMPLYPIRSSTTANINNIFVSLKSILLNQMNSLKQNKQKNYHPPHHNNNNL